ncbi:MAG: glycoside hydrolase N-terminal domain-containing protein [Gemmatimonadota bacterium]|nr:glycoside hydrolase N-terminal domain-containing protein [Gemmatimonadota bacterium]
MTSTMLRASRVCARVVAPCLFIGLAATVRAQPRPTSNLRLAAPITTWDEAIPLGNGLLGGLVWGGGSRINLSLDRADLWDLRPAAPYGTEGYRWADIQRLVAARAEDSLHMRFDDPYEQVPHPTKLPGGRVVLTLEDGRYIQSFLLDLARAEAQVQLTRGTVRGFFGTADSVALFEVPALRRVDLVRPASLDKLGYPPATVGGDTVAGVRTQWMLQRAAEGLTYVLAVSTQRTGDSSLVAVSIATSADGADPLAIARHRIADALTRGYLLSARRHAAWWARYWRSVATLTVPDTALQAHLDLVQYYYAAAARRGTPPIPLQGVWTADANTLPPWKGDLHNDLNTQMTYLAAHASGAEEAMRGWLDYNWKLLPTYRRFARDFYGVDGAAIPGVMALDGRALGGWGQYSLSPTMGLWVAQSFHLEWQYTRDADFLRDRAYPFVAAIGRAARALLQEGPNGRLRLPLSSSPELYDNSLKAWLPQSSNFDLALLHWAFGALDEMATALGDTTAGQGWRATRTRLEPLAIDAASGALAVAAGLPLAESHRHFSNAMAIHPLGLLTVDAPVDTLVVQRTVNQLRQFGTGEWMGYSYAWYSAMLARSGRGDEALRYLEDYRRGFLLRNGFHANGEQTRLGLSNAHYRPVTLEGNFLALHAAQEMLLQGWGGVVRVFPALSERWRDVSFRDLRAEGGWRVSAWRERGVTQRVRIESTAGGRLRLRDPFNGAVAEWNRADLRRVGAEYVIDLPKGAVLTGTFLR